MTSVNDIINNIPNTTTQSTRERLADLAKLSNKINTQNAYESRDALEKEGIGRIYDDLQKEVSFNAKYSSAANIAANKLEMQKIKIDEIRTVLNQFVSDTSSLRGDKANLPGAGTAAEVADKALDRIGKILNTRVAGEYIFGGKNANKPPVEVDLTKNSNLDSSGLPTTNYTKTSSIKVESQISQKYTVDLGVVDATNPGISNYIAAINLFKSSNGAAADRVDELIKDGADEFGRLDIKVSTQLQYATEAIKDNKTDIAGLQQKVKAITDIDVTSLVNNFRSNVNSILANFSINDALNSILSKLINR